MDEAPLFEKTFQKDVLKLLCTNTKFFHEYGNLLKPEYFETQQLRVLFDLIIKYITEFECEIEKKDLYFKVCEYAQIQGYSLDGIKDLKKNVLDIFDSVIKSEQFIINSVVKFVRRQEMKKALYKAVKIVEEDESFEKIVGLINETVSIGAGAGEGLNYIDVQGFPELYRAKYNEKNLCTSGFTNFNYALLGGFGSGEVHTIIGSPKVGKSTFGANIGVGALAMGKVVYHITLEIEELDLLSKYATRISGMTYRELLLNGIDEDYRNKIKYFEKYTPKLFIKFYPEQSVNAYNLRSWISKKRSKTNLPPDLIIVDYDDLLLATAGKQDDMYEKAGQVYTDLISLANYFKCGVITFSQPQRHCWTKYNNNELIYANEMAHSAKKAHKAWSVSSLNFKEGEEEGIWYIDRNRRGESGVQIKLRRDLTKALFREL